LRVVVKLTLDIGLCATGTESKSLSFVRARVQSDCCTSATLTR
jgi:hypothetical protein